MTGALKFGIAGWAYRDWRDVVYPRGCKDTLRFCAGFVDHIEINSTFYQVPSARNCAAWVRRVDGLATRFSAKVPQEFTHALARDDTLARETRQGFAPLAESGRLRTLLAQFHYRFDCAPAHLEHLGWIRDAFAATAPLTVEVRHASWTTPRGLDGLRALGVAVANLDYPGGAEGFGVRATHLNGPHDLAYFRLHGRNPAWFEKNAGRDEVYDYEYPAAEVADIGRRADELARQAQETVVVANNHFQGKAMKLVVELLAAHRGTRVPVPAPLVAAYPELHTIAERAPGMLF